MALKLRQKVTIILLALYWPVLFALAHIPIPQLVQEAGVSDKSVHFLSYLILVFFLWFSFNFDRKVVWRRASVWLVLFLIVLYAVFDEFSQTFVGRTCDVMDFTTDIVGVLTGLVMFSIFGFWSSALLVIGIVIFGVTNIARTNLAEVMPVANALFNFFGYGLFTIVWICRVRLSCPQNVTKSRWLLSVLVVPMVFLLFVRLFSSIIGRSFDVSGTVLSVMAIVIVTGVVFILSLTCKLPTVGQERHRGTTQE